MIRDLMRHLDYPEEAVDFLGNAFDTVAEDPFSFARLYDAADKLFLTSGSGFSDDVKAVVDRTCLHKYTVDLLLALTAGRSLHYLYRHRGMDDEMFYRAMRDTRCKLLECKTVYGIWGTFVFDDWYPGFYRLYRFALGRLQYDVGKNYLGTDEGRLEADMPAVACHIPSDGPLTRKSVLSSLKAAYTFLPQVRKDGKLLVMCHSWLLYTPLIERLPKNGNVRAFYDLFRVVSTAEDPANGDYWRFFGTMWHEGALEEVRADTSLKRAVIDLMREGGSLGTGLGYILFDGENADKGKNS